MSIILDIAIVRIRKSCSMGCDKRVKNKDYSILNDNGGDFKKSVICRGPKI